jgi:prepilin-type processing-associated H-X9-DG protein
MFLYLEENSSYLPQSKYWTICMEIEQGGVVPVDCVKCPSSNPPEDTYYVTPISDVIGYGMNIYINDHRFGDFKYPSQTLVMCDANVYQFDLYYWGSRIIPRHRSGINVLFLDCHVRWQNQETTINRDKTMWTVYDTP